MSMYCCISRFLISTYYPKETQQVHHPQSNRTLNIETIPPPQTVHLSLQHSSFHHRPSLCLSLLYSYPHSLSDSSSYNNDNDNNNNNNKNNNNNNNAFTQQGEASQ